MSSLVTTAALVNYEEDNNEKKNTLRKNHTYKNKDAPKKINKNMLEQLYNSNTNDSDLDNMGDFEPVQKPIQNNSQTQEEVLHKPPMQYNDNPIDETMFNGLQQNNQQANMYKEYIDNYNNYTSKPQISNPNNELLKKLDSILFLLEEQKEEQTHLITEELILYVFLGVFVIYVLDSFVRAGKYVR